MRKSRRQLASAQGTRNTKNARSRTTAKRKSSQSNGSGSVLHVATPQSKRLQFLDELEMIAPEGMEASARDVPLDFTGLSSEGVGQQHSEWAVRLGYCLYEISIRASRLGSLKGAIKDKRVPENKIKKAQREISVLQEEVTLLKGIADAYKQFVAAASREMTRRGIEVAPRD